MKEDLINALLEKRPLLSNSSLKTYASLLLKVLRQLEINSIAEIDASQDKLVSHIEKIDNPQTRKTILSPLVILSEGEKADTYKTMMTNATRIINEKYKSQKITPEKLSNMKTMDQLREFNKMLQDKYRKSKSNVDLQELLISYLFTGILEGLPPRRLQDYVMKTRNYDSKEDNHTDGKYFYFNRFKTQKHLGSQKIPVPKQIRNLVKKAILQNTESDFLLHTAGRPYTAPAMSKKLKRTYGVSVDGLRAIYLSHMYKGLPLLSKMDEVAEQMGHSPEVALQHYVKSDLQR